MTTLPLTVTAWLRWDAVQPLLPATGGRVLDIGAGTGTIGSFLADRYEYVGVEPDPISHTVASERIGTRGVVRNIAIEKLDPAGDFDLVCAFEVLEHIDDDADALSLWSRHLRPGGSIIVSVPRGRDRFSEGDARLGHFRRYDPPELAGKLRDAGFTSVETVVYGSPWGNGQEAVRGVVFRLRPSVKPLAERTAESARFLQPPAWGAHATHAISVPLRYIQRPLASRDVGTGVIAVGRLPDGDTPPRGVFDLARRGDERVR
jgi:SAM-dependent methyltransferase